MTSVIILAGSREEDCPLCIEAKVASKALVPLGGVRMIDHMLRALRDAPELDGDIWISGLCPKALAVGAPDDLAAFIGQIKPAGAGKGPATAVLSAVAHGAQMPLLVTTCDHPLLTPAMVACFLEGARARHCDFAVGLATRTVISKAYPKARRTYLPFGREGYSGCNLFLIRSEPGMNAVAFWRDVGKDRKKPWKLARHLSLGTFFRMMFGRLELERAFTFGSRRIKATIAPIIIPIAEAAIDVDKPADLVLVSSILAKAG